jgi:molecular chaperone DnaK
VIDAAANKLTEATGPVAQKMYAAQAEAAQADAGGADADSGTMRPQCAGRRGRRGV